MPLIITPLFFGFIEPHPRTFWTVWALLVGVPISVLAISWIQFFRKRRIPPRPALLGPTLALTLLSLSDVIFLCALAGRLLWGRYTIIGINLIVALLLVALALVMLSKKNPLADWIFISAVVMLLAWFYAAAATSAV
jgi:hypothetical protein